MLDNSLEAFLRAVGFIAPEGTTLDYFIVTPDTEVPESDIIQPSKRFPPTNSCITYDWDPDCKVDYEAPTFTTGDAALPTIPRSGFTVNPEGEKIRKAYMSPLNKKVFRKAENSTARRTNIILNEKVGPFPAGTVLSFVKKSLKETANTGDNLLLSSVTSTINSLLSEITTLQMALKNESALLKSVDELNDAYGQILDKYDLNDGAKRGYNLPGVFASSVGQLSSDDLRKESAQASTYKEQLAEKIKQESSCFNVIVSAIKDLTLQGARIEAIRENILADLRDTI